jgi:hypothetical protein
MTWLGASYVLGRPVPVDEPYPHICRFEVPGTVTRRLVKVERGDCASCRERRASSGLRPV